MSNNKFESWYIQYHETACEEYGGIDCSDPMGIAEHAWGAALASQAQEAPSEPILCVGLEVKEDDIGWACAALTDQTIFDGDAILKAWNKLVRFYHSHKVKQVTSMEAPSEPVGRVKTRGGYPDESRHTVEWLVKYKELRDGDLLYRAALASQSQEAPSELVAFIHEANIGKDCVPVYSASEHRNWGADTQRLYAPLFLHQAGVPK